MQVFHDISQLSSITRPLHLAVGVFDGVHLGHQAVIRAAQEGSRANGGIPILVTFDPHPIRILRPDEAPRILSHCRHKLRKVERLGIDHALVVTFDEEFSRKTGAEFVRELCSAAKDIRQICVGKDWKFGCQRSGDFALLQSLGAEQGFEATGVEAFLKDGIPVSSTGIRELIRRGNLDQAAKLLGAPYDVSGTVVEGDQLGRKLGFPTANLLVHSEQLPPSGVYAVPVILHGNHFSGVANLGTRPTFSDKNDQRRLEVHLLDYEGTEFYGKDVEVVFRRFLRSEIKFPGPEKLIQQIHNDIRQAREVLAPG